MKLRDLEATLQNVCSFQQPRAELEQYPTSPHLASHLVHVMHSCYDDVEGRLVCDLGCGTGILAIGAAVLGAEQVVGVDIDEKALSIASSNVADYELQHVIDLLCIDLANSQQWALINAHKKFDTVVMNPPFGTKRKGIDILFLVTALNLAQNAVYSMHKSSTRDFIQRKSAKWGIEATVSQPGICRFQYRLSAERHMTVSKSNACALTAFRLHNCYQILCKCN